MTSVIDLPGNETINVQNDIDEFKTDVTNGLSKKQKQISSKYFYDEHGSELFNQITRHPSYYLTRCEIEILNDNKQSLADLMGAEAFNLVELGPGEGIKTNILVEHFLHQKQVFRYIPIDISKKYLQILADVFHKQMPQLKYIPVHSDYFKGLEWLNKHSERRNLVLFLGSSIGNFTPQETKDFFEHLWHSLRHNDYVLIGFDLRKDIDILLRAYDDSDGITRNFNMNLLQRINRELKADFNLEKFTHYPTYNVHTGAMESYIVSLERQAVSIQATKQKYFFEAVEPIHVEFSHKYLLSQIEELAMETGFEILSNFTDEKNFFVDSLWRVNKRVE